MMELGRDLFRRIATHPYLPESSPPSERLFHRDYCTASPFEETSMFATIRFRTLPAISLAALALVPPADAAQAQFGGMPQPGRTGRSSTQHPLVTALRKQQHLLQDAARQSTRMLTGLQQNNVTSDRLMRELHRQHKELKASLLQTNNLLNGLTTQTGLPQQNVLLQTNNAFVTGLQQQQLAVAAALQQTNALHAALLQNGLTPNGLVTGLQQQQLAVATALQQTNALLNALPPRMQTRGGR
jgi:hypothetical protein